MWEEIESRDLHRARYGRVTLARVQGPAGPLEVLSFDGPPISLAVPFLADGRIVLVKQHRPAWKLTSWECPAGHGEPGETAEETARRELAEETGYTARRLERLLEVRASAKVANPFTLFSAHELEAGAAHPDSDEDIEVRAFSPAEVRALIARGEIVHAPSLVGLLATIGR